MLPSEIWAYLQQGDEDLPGVRMNQHALQAVRLVPRPLADVCGGHTWTTLFDQSLRHPLLIAPVAYQRLFHPDGEMATAVAAEAQHTPMLVSSLASQPFEHIAATGVPFWFQLYWQGDRATTLALLHRAEACGARAVVFTVDAPVKQASLQLPSGIEAVNLPAPPTPPAAPLRAIDGSAVFEDWMIRAPHWDDLQWLRDQTTLPLLVKGLIHPEDAVRAMAAGCDGVVVSNHGGRVLAGTPTSVHALVAIRERLGPSVPVLFDSGVRSGADVFRAIALGADAVLIGRPVIWGLTVGGGLGVAHLLRLLRDELELTMALTGCASIAAIRGACESFTNQNDSQ